MSRLFGTDGVRGIAGEQLSAELALRIGRASAQVLAGDARRRPRFVIGCDTRLSSDMLVSALSAGLCSAGADVWMLGVVPTPAVAFLIGKYKADAGVMVSASHNPAEYNGIKLFGGDGFKLPDALEDQIEAFAGAEMRVPAPAHIGTVTAAPHAVRDYVEHVQSTALYSLDGLRVAIDCANGSASATAKELFEGLGAECYLLHTEPNGLNINENCGSTHMEALQACVRERELDAGVAFDGDADRCLCVDDTGAVVDGDALMTICALDMKNRGRLSRGTVVGTVMSNLGLVKFCEQQGIRFLSAKVGDRYVLEQMQLEGANFGGEQSGHLIFRDFATTGDGQLTAVQVLSLLRRSGSTLSALAAAMKRYPQVSDAVSVSAEGKVRFYTDGEVRQHIEAAGTALGEHGRVVVRPSGTEPLIRVMAEGEDVAQITRLVADLCACIKARLG